MRARLNASKHSVTMRFPTELARAARRVADANGLPRNWLNGAEASSTPISATKLTASQSRSPPPPARFSKLPALGRRQQVHID